jgi:hypothetical protein
MAKNNCEGEVEHNELAVSMEFRTAIKGCRVGCFANNFWRMKRKLVKGGREVEAWQKFKGLLISVTSTSLSVPYPLF